MALEITKIDALLADWDRRHPDPRDRLGQYVRMFGTNRRDLQRISKKLLDRFCDWLETQFGALGHTQEARSLALHLLARTQGMSVIAHAYNDSGVIEHEVRGLERWIDSLGKPGLRVPGLVRGQKRS